MSDMTTLSQLAQFRPTSPLASDEAGRRDDALRALLRGLEPHKPVRRRVTDMLAVVMALSARTRRMVLPPVSVELDVFSPDGQRAVRIYFPEAD